VDAARCALAGIFPQDRSSRRRFRSRGTLTAMGIAFVVEDRRGPAKCHGYFCRVRARNVAYRFAELRGRWKCHATGGEVSKLSSYRLPRDGRGNVRTYDLSCPSLSVCLSLSLSASLEGERSLFLFSDSCKRRHHEIGDRRRHILATPRRPLGCKKQSCVKKSEKRECRARVRSLRRVCGRLAVLHLSQFERALRIYSLFSQQTASGSRPEGEGGTPAVSADGGVKRRGIAAVKGARGSLDGARCVNGARRSANAIRNRSLFMAKRHCFAEERARRNFAAGSLPLTG